LFHSIGQPKWLSGRSSWAGSLEKHGTCAQENTSKIRDASAPAASRVDQPPCLSKSICRCWQHAGQQCPGYSIRNGHCAGGTSTRAKCAVDELRCGKLTHRARSSCSSASALAASLTDAISDAGGLQGGGRRGPNTITFASKAAVRGIDASSRAASSGDYHLSAIGVGGRDLCSGFDGRDLSSSGGSSGSSDHITSCSGSGHFSSRFERSSWSSVPRHP